jgi:hypothetical protein
MSIKQYIEEKFQVTESLKIDLVKGEKYEVPSGVGGAFVTEYMGKEGDRHKFKNLNKEWAKSKLWKYFLFTDDKVNEFVKPYRGITQNFGFKG